MLIGHSLRSTHKAIAQTKIHATYIYMSQSKPSCLRVPDALDLARVSGEKKHSSNFLSICWEFFQYCTQRQAAFELNILHDLVPFLLILTLYNIAIPLKSCTTVP